MRTVGQKGLYNLFESSHVALIVISVILIGLVECKEKVRIFSKRKKYTKSSIWVKKWAFLVKSIEYAPIKLDSC